MNLNSKDKEQYWTKRSEQRLINSEKSTNEMLKRLKKVYKSSIQEIEKEINAFYGKYATETGLDITEVKKMLDKFMIGSGGILEKLQEENEELKEKIKVLDAMTGIFSVRLANKYKLALEEIKKIANSSTMPPCLENIFEGEWDCKNCDDDITNNGETCMEYGLEKIRKIINEVLNDRD